MSTYETRAEIEERIKNTARRVFKKLAPPDGTHKFVVTSQMRMPNPSKGDRDGNGAGCICYALHVAPLKNPEDANSVMHEFETTKWLTLNIVNPDVEGHKVDSKTDNEATRDLSAILPERVPYVALKLPSGEWDNTPETKVAKSRAIVEAAVVSTEIAEGTLDLTGSFFVANTKKAPEDKGYYLNNLRSELRPGESFTDLTGSD